MRSTFSALLVLALSLPGPWITSISRSPSPCSSRFEGQDTVRPKKDFDTWKSFKISIKTRREELKNDLIGDSSEKDKEVKSLIAIIDATLLDLDSMEMSCQSYGLDHIKSMESGSGWTDYDTGAKRIIIHYGPTANFIHESMHAWQFEKGDIGFRRDKGTPVAQDLSDEVAAYKAQFAYEPSGTFPSPAPGSLEGITEDWVHALKNSKGDSLYTLTGEAKTGIKKVNIDSSKSELIAAYPNTNFADALMRNTNPLYTIRSERNAIIKTNPCK